MRDQTGAHIRVLSHEQLPDCALVGGSYHLPQPLTRILHHLHPAPLPLAPKAFFLYSNALDLSRTLRRGG
jgi:hypothetical protein